MADAKQVKDLDTSLGYEAIPYLKFGHKKVRENFSFYYQFV